jgi:Na+/H+ antiporter NhaB
VDLPADAGPARPKQKLTRADREALAAQREAERKTAERRQWRRSLMVQAVAWAVVVGLALGLALLLLRGLRVADERLQAQYKADL